MTGFRINKVIDFFFAFFKKQLFYYIFIVDDYIWEETLIHDYPSIFYRFVPVGVAGDADKTIFFAKMPLPVVNPPI